ncbi:substrate-binding periplasmic protein [Vibrio sp. NTOU-M3]|uniref:substrate-binding periplasmic protein n=1 Tax=Vibrio sp. NTOU-M3 TaxID=3234954 RepID=UPI00349FB29A
MRLVKWICIFILALSTQALSAQLNELTFITEEYPPYNYVENGRTQGIAVDLLLEASEVAGTPLKREEILVQPWARGYRSTLVKNNTVLFSTTRTELREHLFQWVGPLSDTRIVVLAKKSLGAKIISPVDLAKFRIGVIRDDVGEQLLLELGVPRNSMVESSHAEILANQLYKGRTDLWAYEENVAKWWLSQAGYDLNQFEVVYVLQQGELYYAFNANISEEIVASLQNAINKLKHDINEDGTSQYESIVKKYW